MATLQRTFLVKLYTDNIFIVLQVFVVFCNILYAKRKDLEY